MLVWLVSMACAPAPVLDASPASSPEDNAARVSEALRARGAGDYASAIRILREVVDVEPRPEWMGLLAETQAWGREFVQAESVYRTALDRWPDSRDLQFGLARVLAWLGRYPEARRILSQLVGRDADDVDALEWLGRVEYWSGDFRSAARIFRGVLGRRPGSADALRSLGEIESASAARYEMSADYGSDDQPYRLGRLQARGSVFSDPLTRWDGTAGAYFQRADDPGGASGTVPYARLDLETVIPSLRLTVAPWIGALRFADGHSEGLFGVSLRRPVGPSGILEVRVERRELLTTRSSIDDHPTVTSASLSWDWQPRSGWLARVDAAGLRAFDGNDGSVVNAFALAPLGSLSGFAFWIGPAFSFRDTDESRFRLVHTQSVPLGGGEYRYVYSSEYAPYWTPQRLREVRLAAVVSGPLSRTLAAKVQIEGGWARDRAVGFGPETGSSAVPPPAFSFFYGRSYHPWRLAASLIANLAAGIRLEIGYEHRVTVFYESDSLHATLGGRF